MTRQVKHNPSHWGSHDYLYGPLTHNEILALEEAIFARRLGRYKQARQLFDEKLPPCTKVAVLAIEKAELEARLMRHRARLDILETFLVSQNEWREQPSEQEIKLLMILAAAAKIEVYGNLKVALLEARKMKSMWQGRAVKEWTLSEVRMRFHSGMCAPTMKFKKSICERVPMM